MDLAEGRQVASNPGLQRRGTWSNTWTSSSMYGGQLAGGDRRRLGRRRGAVATVGAGVSRCRDRTEWVRRDGV
jgi:hypothetical protein